MPATFSMTRRVEFSDTDMAGIVHFARFFCYMETAEHELLRSLGLSVVMEREGERISFPRVSASCDYLRPARLDDLLTIHVTINKIGRKSVTYGFEVFKEDEMLAKGQITTVCCVVGEDHRLEPRDLPDGIRTLLEHGQ